MSRCLSSVHTYAFGMGLPSLSVDDVTVSCGVALAPAWVLAALGVDVAFVSFRHALAPAAKRAKAKRAAF